MITEIAILFIKPDTHGRFEAAFAGVERLLADADGHIWHRLASTEDRAHQYLLEVEWRDLAAHIEAFEPSSAHAEFMAALEPFLLGEPTVIHVRTATRRERFDGCEQDRAP